VEESNGDILSCAQSQQERRQLHTEKGGFNKVIRHVGLGTITVSGQFSK
jgi:hypothetical protein